MPRRKPQPPANVVSLSDYRGEREAEETRRRAEILADGLAGILEQLWGPEHGPGKARQFRENLARQRAEGGEP